MLNANVLRNQRLNDHTRRLRHAVQNTCPMNVHQTRVPFRTQYGVRLLGMNRRAISWTASLHWQESILFCRAAV
jgi:hypothetical protein